MSKEIYFENDVFSDVAEELGIQKDLVKWVFNSYINGYKELINSTDDIAYRLPHLGTLIISSPDALREMHKFKKRAYRESNRVAKAELRAITKRYRQRVKKAKIELIKLKYDRGSSLWRRFSKGRMELALSNKSYTIPSRQINSEKILRLIKEQNRISNKVYERNQQS